MKSRPPSKVRDDYWVYAINPCSSWEPTERSGKWLIFAPWKKLDDYWKIIEEETIAGRLGTEAKAATAKKNVLAKNPWIKVICVYTYDSADVEDVRRVRQRLQKIGFTKKLSYKTDEATLAGKYSDNNGGCSISLFFE